MGKGKLKRRLNIRPPGHGISLGEGINGKKMGIVAGITMFEVAHFATPPGVAAPFTRGARMVPPGLGLCLDLVVEEPLNGLLDGGAELLALPGHLAMSKETKQCKGGGTSGDGTAVPSAIRLLRHLEITQKAHHKGLGVLQIISVDLGIARIRETTGVNAGHLVRRGGGTIHATSNFPLLTGRGNFPFGHRRGA